MTRSPAAKSSFFPSTMTSSPATRSNSLSIIMTEGAFETNYQNTNQADCRPSVAFNSLYSFWKFICLALTKFPKTSSVLCPVGSTRSSPAISSYSLSAYWRPLRALGFCSQIGGVVNSRVVLLSLSFGMKVCGTKRTV
jgi:hypothetical protein